MERGWTADHSKQTSHHGQAYGSQHDRGCYPRATEHGRLLVMAGQEMYVPQIQLCVSTLFCSRTCRRSIVPCVICQPGVTSDYILARAQQSIGYSQQHAASKLRST